MIRFSYVRITEVWRCVDILLVVSLGIKHNEKRVYSQRNMVEINLVQTLL